MTETTLVLRQINPSFIFLAFTPSQCEEGKTAEERR